MIIEQLKNSGLETLKTNSDFIKEKEIKTKKKITIKKINKNKMI